MNHINFLVVDSQVWIITTLGWLIVFVALIFLIIVFNQVPKLLGLDVKKLIAKKEKVAEQGARGSEIELTGETNAAIAMALYMYFNELHDEESNVITIKKVTRNYSPWSSKVYGFNNVNFPR